MIEHHRPQNVMELVLVERIASAQWKLIRLAKAEAEQIEDDAQAMQTNHAKEANWMTRSMRNGFYESDHDMTREQFTARRDAHEKLAAQKPSAARVLAAGFAQNDAALHRMAIYEQRLERSILRAAAELRKMRKEAMSCEEAPDSLYANEKPDGGTGLRRAQSSRVLPASNTDHINKTPLDAKDKGEMPMPQLEDSALHENSVREDGVQVNVARENGVQVDAARENGEIKATAPARPVQITLRPALARRDVSDCRA